MKALVRLDVAFSSLKISVIKITIADANNNWAVSWMSVSCIFRDLEKTSQIALLTQLTVKIVLEREILFCLDGITEFR